MALTNDSNYTDPVFTTDPGGGSGGMLPEYGETGMGEPDPTDPLTNTPGTSTPGTSTPGTSTPGTSTPGTSTTTPPVEPLGGAYVPVEADVDPVNIAAPGPITATKAVGSNATSTGYGATTQTVDSNQLAATQLSNILSKDSPLAQRARQEGYLAAGSRGLQNSSIAGEAAYGALVDRATPLALQDASTYAAQALANQQYLNTASQFGANAENTAVLQNALVAADISKANAANQTTVDVENMKSALSVSLTEAELKNTRDLQNMVNQGQVNIEMLSRETQMNLAIANNLTDVQIAQMDADTKATLAQMELTSNEAIAALEAANAQAIAKYDGAKGIIAQAIAANGMILSTEGVSPAEAQAKIDMNMAFAQSQIDFLSAFTITTGDTTIAGGAVTTPGTAPATTPPTTTTQAPVGWPAGAPWPPFLGAVT